MLCPNCKNEKWNDEICPRCGMDQKTALLSKGDLYQQEGRNLEAARYYEDYLKLDPGQWDAVRKRAVAWYSAALNAKDKNAFTKADQALAEALEQEWDWEQGHQFRVNLSYEYGLLEEIKDQYERAAEIPDRKDQAEKTTKIIFLTERFAAPADEEASLSPKKSWLSSDWLTFGLVLAVPIWLWFLTKTLFPSTAQASGGGTFLLVGTLCGAGFILFLVVRFFRKEVKTSASPDKPRKKSELNFPPE